MSIDPFQSRDGGFLPYDMVIKGVSFSSTDEVVTAYNLDRYQLDYTYDFSNSTDWKAKLMGILSVEDMSFRMVSLANDKAIKEDFIFVVPYVYGTVGFKAMDRLWLSLTLGGTAVNNHTLFNPEAQISYELSTHWETAMKISYFNLDVEKDHFVNESCYSSLQIHMKYLF